MKNLGLMLFALLLVTCGASAQVSVEILTDQEQFMPSEAIPIAVRVVNRSGQAIRLGKEADWLTFSVEAKDGMIVPKIGDVPVVQEFVLDSSKMATKHVDLAPYFNMSALGRYSVTASVKIKDWGLTVTSQPQVVEVVRGVKLWEQEIGVPPASPTDHSQPEVRKFSLEQTPYSEHMKLYLRVTDVSESQVYKIFQVGPMISFSRPEPELDAQNNLHLLYQSSGHMFLYSVINPQGEVVLRQTYDYSSTRPHLKQDKSGRIGVAGGVRHVADNDIPPSQELPLANVAPPAKP